MKRKTYNNIIKASKMIQKKGYTKEESLNLALKVFDEQMYKGSMSAEWFIDKMLTKEEYENERR